jgi:hypothetical protein
MYERPFALVRQATNRTVQPIAVDTLTPVRRAARRRRYRLPTRSRSLFKNTAGVLPVRHADQHDRARAWGHSAHHRHQPTDADFVHARIFCSDMYAVTDAAHRSVLVAGQLSTADQFAGIVADR